MRARPSPGAARKNLQQIQGFCGTAWEVRRGVLEWNAATGNGQSRLKDMMELYWLGPSRRPAKFDPGEPITWHFMKTLGADSKNLGAKPTPDLKKKLAREIEPALPKDWPAVVEALKAVEKLEPAPRRRFAYKHIPDPPSLRQWLFPTSSRALALDPEGSLRRIAEEYFQRYLVESPKQSPPARRVRHRENARRFPELTSETEN